MTEIRSLQKEQVKMVVLLVVTASVSFLTIIGLSLWIMDIITAEGVWAFAFVVNVIQIILLSRLIPILNGLVQKATAENTRLGYKPKGLSEDDYLGANRAYAKMMFLSTAFTLTFPWLMVMVLLF